MKLRMEAGEEDIMEGLEDRADRGVEEAIREVEEVQREEVAHSPTMGITEVQETVRPRVEEGVLELQEARRMEEMDSPGR